MSTDASSTKKERYHINLVGGGGTIARATKAVKGGKLRGRKNQVPSKPPGSRPVGGRP